MRALCLVLTLGALAACSSDAPKSESSSSSGAPVDSVPDAGSCGFTSTLGCDAPDSRCVGSARNNDGKLDLTTPVTTSEPQTGVYWQHLALARDASFTLTVQISTSQPEGGGIQGHGFAMVFVQDDSEPIDFPGLRVERPAYLGINVLEGFHGAGAYLKTYNGGTSGVFALRTTQIPSADPSKVDDWEGRVGNTESFARTDPTWLRFVIEGRPGVDPTVEMIRGDDASFTTSHSVQTVTIALPAMDRLDYFGIAAARGNDGYSQSGHRLESLALACASAP